MRECGTPISSRGRSATMKKRTWVVGVAAALVLARDGVFYRGTRSSSQKAVGAGAPRRPARRRRHRRQGGQETVPVRLEALGTVTPIASVAIKPRLDSEIIGVHFEDGAMVKQGDLLFIARRPLDRGRDQAGRGGDRRRRGAVRAGRRATSQRYTDLVAKNATTVRSRSTTRRPRSTSRARSPIPTRRRSKT